MFKKTIEEQSSVPFDGSFLQPGKFSSEPNPDISLQDAILTRRTVRSYGDELVSFEVFKELISISMHAPTACNEQRWKILYLDDTKILEELYWRGTAAFVRKTKQAFIVLYNNHSDNTQYKDHIQSASALINTFSLAAHSIGIGSCWVGHLPNKSELKRMFKIHRLYEPIALVTFGYYRSKVKIKPRKQKIDQIISINKFSDKELSFSTSKNVFLRRFARRLYYFLPPSFRKRLRKKSLPFEKKFYYETYD